MRVLALDLGSKRVGVAVSDATGILASPLTTIMRSGDRRVDHRAVARLVEEEGAELLVVGLPLRMDGTRGPAALAAEAEAAELAGVLMVPVELVDERLTTVAADKALLRQGKRAPARRQVVDRTAAAIMLQGWLDGGGGRRDSGSTAGEGSVSG